MIAVFLLLFASLGFAADKSFEIKPCKGMVTAYDGVGLSDDFCTNSENVNFDGDVGTRKRGGYDNDNTVNFGSQTVSGLWRFVTTGEAEYLVLLSSHQLYYTLGNSSYTLIISTVDSSVVTEAVQAFGRLWLTNRLQSFTWTGGALTGNTVSGFPEGRYIAFYGNRLWVAGVDNNRSILYVSEHLDGDSWDIGSDPTDPAQFSIGLNDGDTITGVIPYNGALVIFKRTSTWVLTGLSQLNFRVTQISNNIGCVQNRSIRVKQGRLVWLSHRGLEVMSNFTITNPPKSDVVKDIADGIIQGYGVETRSKLLDTEQGDFSLGVSTYSDLTTTAGSVRITSPTIAASTQPITENGPYNTHPDWGWSFTPKMNTNLLYAQSRFYVTVIGSTYTITITTSGSGFFPYYPLIPFVGASSCTFIAPVIDSGKYLGCQFSPGFGLTGGTTYWAIFSRRTGSTDSRQYYTTNTLATTFLREHNVYSVTVIEGGGGSGSNFTIHPSSFPIMDMKLSSTTMASRYHDIRSGVSSSRVANFNFVRVPDGGVITYYTRFGTGTEHTSQRPWIETTAGSTIAITTHTLFQWRADIGIYFSSQSPALQEVSLTWVETVDKQTVASWVVDDRYLLAHTTNNASGAFNDAVLVLDKFDNFGIYRGIRALSFADAFEETYFGTSFSSGAYSGIVYKLTDSFNDNGDVITSFIETTDFCGDQPDCYSRKDFKEVWIKTLNDASSGGTLFTKIQYNRDGTETDLGDVSLTEATGLIFSKVFFPMGSSGTQGRTVRFKFGNSQADHDFSFYGARVIYEPYPRD